MPISGSGSELNVPEKKPTERAVVIKIHNDEFEAYVTIGGGEAELVTKGSLNLVTHDCDIDRSFFPVMPEDTEVRILVKNPHSWSGRLWFHGDVLKFTECPRCWIDPLDCGEHD